MERGAERHLVTGTTGRSATTSTRSAVDISSSPRSADLATMQHLTQDLHPCQPSTAGLTTTSRTRSRVYSSSTTAKLSNIPALPPRRPLRLYLDRHPYQARPLRIPGTCRILFRGDHRSRGVRERSTRRRRPFACPRCFPTRCLRMGWKPDHRFHRRRPQQSTAEVFRAYGWLIVVNSAPPRLSAR
jgi:hypothetical protein